MSGRQKIAVLNLSPSLPDSVVSDLAQAGRIYGLIVAKALGLRAPLIEFMPGHQVAPAGWVASVFAATMDEPGALAYHAVDPQGRPYMRNCLGVIPGHVVMRDPSGHGASLCGAWLHELAETLGDRTANLWAQGDVVDQTGARFSLVARELCDPNQDAAHELQLADGRAFDAPDFVLDDYFNAELEDDAPRPLSWLATLGDPRGLTRPFSVGPGGYLIVANVGEGGQVFGRARVCHETPPPEWREAGRGPGRRSHRRLEVG